MTGQKDDPYDTFGYIDEQVKIHGCKTLYFFPDRRPGALTIITRTTKTTNISR